MSSGICVVIMIAVILLISRNTLYCWKFSILGLDEDEITLSKVTIYGLRAFVAVPRVHKNQTFTLIEVPWPEHSALSVIRPFPNPESQVRTKASDNSNLHAPPFLKNYEILCVGIYLDDDQSVKHQYFFEQKIKVQIMCRVIETNIVIILTTTIKK